MELVTFLVGSLIGLFVSLLIGNHCGWEHKTTIFYYLGWISAGIVWGLL